LLSLTSILFSFLSLAPSSDPRTKQRD
jgi:hypothetical protein